MLLEKLSEPTPTNGFEKNLIDSFSSLFEEMRNKEQYVIMLMYLWIATARGTTLREACEEFQISRECGMSSTVDTREPLIAEYTITLKPRVQQLDISISELNDYQMKVAKFLQDIIEEINKNNKNNQQS